MLGRSLVLLACSITANCTAPAKFTDPAARTDSSLQAGVPLIGPPTSLSHFDNHWYMWLPRHPTYEAVEVMSKDRPIGGPLVWVFFTERAGPKRQDHFYNDQTYAAQRGGRFRDISYATTGSAPGALGLDVKLADVQGQDVVISVEFDGSPPLIRRPGATGLTNQSGHSADKFFLIFYRDEALRAPRGRATFNGVNRAFLPDEATAPLPFRYTYSSTSETSSTHQDARASSSRMASWQRRGKPGRPSSRAAARTERRALLRLIARVRFLKHARWWTGGPWSRNSCRLSRLVDQGLQPSRAGLPFH